MIINNIVYFFQKHWTHICEYLYLFIWQNTLSFQVMIENAYTYNYILILKWLLFQVQLLFIFTVHGLRR